MNASRISGNKNFHIFPFFILATFALIAGTGCKQREVKWGVVGGDARDLPAMVVSEKKIGAHSIKAQIILMSPAHEIEPISTGTADVSYIDALTCLAAMANKNLDVEIIAVTSRVKSGKPDRLLVARREWLNGFPKGAALVLTAHRNAVRFLQDNKPEAKALAAKWLQTASQTETERILSQTLWESGMDVADLIGLLDDLRRVGTISGPKADELALQFLKKQPLEDQ